MFSAGTDSHGWPVNCVAKYNYVENIPKWHGLDCHGGTNIYFQDNSYLKKEFDGKMNDCLVSAGYSF